MQTTLIHQWGFEQAFERWYRYKCRNKHCQTSLNVTQNMQTLIHQWWCEQAFEGWYKCCHLICIPCQTFQLCLR